MNRSLSKVLTTTALMLMLLGCAMSEGDGGGQNPPPGPPAGPPTGTPPGTLVAEGTGYLHTFDLANGTAWSSRMSYASQWSAVTVVEAQRELLIAHTSGSDPIYVDSIDTTIFGDNQNSSEWPDSTNVLALLHLAATHDGSHLALSMRAFSDPFLEVIERSTGNIVYTGLMAATGSNFVWTPADELVVAIDLDYENDPLQGGVIAAFPLAALADSTDGNVYDGRLIATFTRAEWGHGVRDLALSSDGSQLLFARAGDLWVVDAEQLGPDLEPPHQLTTGPIAIGGAVFSPDGQHIALVAGGPIGLQETYVIPNHRDTPPVHRPRAGRRHRVSPRGPDVGGQHAGLAALIG